MEAVPAYLTVMQYLRKLHFATINYNFYSAPLKASSYCILRGVGSLVSAHKEVSSILIRDVS